MDDNTYVAPVDAYHGNTITTFCCVLRDDEEKWGLFLSRDHIRPPGQLSITRNGRSEITRDRTNIEQDVLSDGRPRCRHSIERTQFHFTFVWRFVFNVYLL